MHTTFLSMGDDIDILYQAEGNGINIDISGYNAGFPSFTYFLNENKWMSLPSPFNQGNILMDSVKLNNTLYYNILRGNESSFTFYWGKDRGLIGWATSVDTFNLANFQIH